MKSPAPMRTWSARPFFWLNLTYLSILILMLVGRSMHSLLVDQIPNPIGGLIPVGVPWFGALGAIMISLYGVFEHNRVWKPEWNYWHAARPVVGAVFAVVAFLIFVGLINATGSKAITLPQTPIDSIPYLVIAFIVGYREQTFRVILKRAIDLLLGPGDAEKAPATVTLSAKPATLPAGPGTAPVSATVVLANGGPGEVTTSTTTARVSPASAAHADLVGLESQHVTAGSHLEGTLTITPQTSAPYEVVVEVADSAGSHSVRLTRD